MKFLRPPTTLSFTATLLGGLFLAVAPIHAQTATFQSTLGGPGTGNGQFQDPTDVAVHTASGRIYVVDNDNNRIQVFDSTGSFQLAWGTTGSGDGQFLGPSSIVINQSTGDVYVVDTGNHRIQRFDASGDFELTWGEEGEDNGQFFTPAYLAINQSTGNVYVTDSSYYRVQQFTADGAYVRQWGFLGTGDGQFIFPAGIGVNSATGQVYVVDQGNSRIQRFSATGVFETKWGITGSGNGQFSTPLGLTLDSAGRVYVGDYGNSRVQVFNGNGAFLLSFGSGSSDVQLRGPINLAVANGKALVADATNDNISVWSLTYPSPSAPTLSLTGSARRATSLSKFPIRGTARDADGTVRLVRGRVGSKGFTKASGTSHWRYTAKLKRGVNRVQIQAVDNSGLSSRVLTVRVTRR